MIIAFDLGMHLGWAVLTDDGARHNSGRHAFPAKPRAKRWIAMAELVRSLLSEYRPRAVVFERPVGRADGGGRATYLVHGGLLAQLEVEAHRAGLPPLLEISPAEWKRATTGSGNASKPRYIEAANQLFKLGLDAKGEDEAAALLVGLAAIKLGKVRIA